MRKIRICDLQPMPPVTIWAETNGVDIRRQQEVVRRQQARITELETRLAKLERDLQQQTLRADYACARADGLEQQYEKLVLLFNHGPLPPLKPQRGLLRRLLNR